MKWKDRVAVWFGFTAAAFFGYWFMVNVLRLEQGKCGACGAPGLYSRDVFWWEKKRRRCETCDPVVELFPGGPRVRSSYAATYHTRARK